MTLRVLFADPDQALLDAYEAFFSRKGFEVATAASGPVCLESLHHWLPDVLVLEPDMPNGWGERILREVHDNSEVRSVHVLILSRRSSLSITYPITEYHVKPFSLGQLAQNIRCVVEV